MSYRWKEKKLSEFIDIIMGQSPKSEFYNFDKVGIPFLQGNRTFGDLYPIYDTWCSNPTKIAKRESVLMSVRAPVGDINIAPSDLCIGRGLSSLTMKNNNNRFLYYLLKANHKKILSNESGTVFGSVNKNTIENISVLVTSNDKEQQAIANILSSLDDKIEVNNKINRNLEELAQTLYKQWFVDFDFPNEDGLPYKTSGGEMIDSELGMIPIGWSYETLGKSKLTKLVRSGIDVFDDKKIYLATADVTDTTITNHNTIITYNEKPSRANMQPKDNTVWFAKMKNSRKLIRVSNESKDIINNYIFSTGFAGLECDKSLNYIWTILSALQFDDLKNSIATGTTQEAINNGVINNIPLLVPKRDILEGFENITKSIFNLIAKNDKENKKLAKMRDLLLPKLMSGEIRVPIKE